MTRRRSLTALAMTLIGTLAFVSAAEAATKTVYAGPPFEKPPAGAPKFLDLNGFYRQRVTINVGDTVSWQWRGFHTVTFLGTQDQPPFVVPDPARPVAGALDPAGAPFWFNGQPNLILNPGAASPSGGRQTNGSQFRNSGLPPMERRPKPHKLKFTKAGNFRYLCLVHPGMTGSVKVVNKRRAVPTARQDAEAARSEATADVRRSRRLAGYKPSGNRVAGGHDRGRVALLEFFPKEKNVKVGDTVEFFVDSKPEIHTFTFGPKSYRTKQGEDLIKPVPPPGGGPPTIQLNPIVAYPSDPPPTLPPYTGANHGGGFLNTGVLDNDPASPSPRGSRVTFTQAGKFEFQCLIHPEMIGTINAR